MPTALAVLGIVIAGSAILYGAGRIEGYRAGGMIGIAVVIVVALKVVARI